MDIETTLYINAKRNVVSDIIAALEQSGIRAEEARTPPERLPYTARTETTIVRSQLLDVLLQPHNGGYNCTIRAHGDPKDIEKLPQIHDAARQAIIKHYGSRVHDR